MSKKFDIPKQSFSAVGDAYNNLLGSNDNRIVDLSVELLDEVPQMFPINEEKVAQIAESIGIEGVGVIDPVVVRKNGERYEILSGRHRVRACKKIGKETVRCQIKNVDDTIARLILLSTNTDRNNDYSPMVYAKAYAEMIDLTKQLGSKAAINTIAEQSGINRKQIYRYIRLNHLIVPLQEWVERRILTIEAAVELSFLSGNKQLAIVEHINSLGIGDSVISKHFKPYVTKNIRNIGETMTDEKFAKNIDKIIFGTVKPEKPEMGLEAPKVTTEDEEMGNQAPKTEPEAKKEQKQIEETEKESIETNESDEDVSIPDETAEKKMGLQAPKTLPDIPLQIYKGGRKTETCSYCQNLFEGEGYSFGADFKDTDPSVTLYIRKSQTAYELVIESNGSDTACSIAYCPKCGRFLDNEEEA